MTPAGHITRTFFLINVFHSLDIDISNIHYLSNKISINCVLPKLQEGSGSIFFIGHYNNIQIDHYHLKISFHPYLQDHQISASPQGSSLLFIGQRGDGKNKLLNCDSIANLKEVQNTSLQNSLALFSFSATFSKSESFCVNMFLLCI